VADPGLTQDDILALLETAQRNNARDQLTGALIYNGQNFMQLLEGPIEKVEACLAAIRADRRHNGMIEIRRRVIEEREFQGAGKLGVHMRDLFNQARRKLFEHPHRFLENLVAGEFLVMASTLCQLKSRELLPREERELEEEEEDPKERLVRRLIDYERFKEAAEELGRRCWLGRDLFARPRTGAEIERPLARDVEALALAEAFSALVQKAKEPAPKHEITLERWSLVQGVEWLLDTLPQGEPVALQGLFTQLDTREQRIQTFMAVLEMAKIQLVDVTQSLHLGPVDVTCLVDAKSADLSSLQDAEQGENRPAIEAQNAKKGA